MQLEIETSLRSGKREPAVEGREWEKTETCPGGVRCEVAVSDGQHCRVAKGHAAAILRRVVQKETVADGGVSSNVDGPCSKKRVSKRSAGLNIARVRCRRDLGLLGSETGLLFSVRQPFWISSFCNNLDFKIDILLSLFRHHGLHKREGKEKGWDGVDEDLVRSCRDSASKSPTAIGLCRFWEPKVSNNQVAGAIVSPERQRP